MTEVSRRILGGRFEVGPRLGEGAMATVFRGVDLTSGLAVAIKVMLPHLVTDPTFTARFKREAEAASMVKHPASVSILHFGEDAGTHFLVMELCEGKDLRSVLEAARRLPELRAINILTQIVEALSVAHGLGIVHRDLKPENVMVNTDGSGKDAVKVLDFGIAKLVDPSNTNRARDGGGHEPPPALTQMGVVIGTPQYMSPEQCRGRPLDGRSDLYTCGILLYHMVTGRLPFDGESPFAVAGMQAFDPPPPPQTLVPSLSPELCSLILKLLSKSADDRTPSAVALLEELSVLRLRLTTPQGIHVAQQPFKPVSKTQALPPASSAANGSPAALMQPVASPSQGPSDLPPTLRQPALHRPSRRWAWAASVALALGVALGVGVYHLLGLIKR